jgi:hypothetical protein
VALPAAADDEPIRDQRLIGSWRSDRERTAEFWRYRPDLDPGTREQIADIFGNLTLRFTEDVMSAEEAGHVSATPYRIVGADYHSVVIEYQGEPVPVVEQLVFEGGYLLRATIGYNLEFFRRVVD